MLPAIATNRTSSALGSSHVTAGPDSSVSRTSKPGTAKWRSGTPHKLADPTDDGRAARRAPSAVQTICLDLLRKGHVRSYLDFFRMVDAPSIHQHQNHSSEALHQLQKLLTAAEVSQRAGQHAQIYASQKAIARHFQSLGKHSVAIGYYREAYERARRISNDRTLEIESTRNLGQALEMDGQPMEASEMYAKSRTLAREQKSSEAETLAAKSLVSVRMKLARNLEKEGEYAEAIAQYTQCVSILNESCPDPRTINDLNYRIGRACQRNDDTPTAIKYLEIFLENVRKHGDVVKEGMAQSALASSYERSGDLARAAEYLQNFLSLTSNDDSQKAGQARACNHLGILYNRMGQFDAAVEHFERHYELACEIGNQAPTTTGRASAVEQGLRKSLENVHEVGSRGLSKATSGSVGVSTEDVNGPTEESETQGLEDEGPQHVNVGVAQVQLGISRGNAYMDHFLDIVKDEKKLDVLLKWKATRSFEVFDFKKDPPDSE
ncbi:hypothetical protein DFS34DRAFT_619691 [Phlyctochytrium arcticum]|nr:hypothetical protein DFS34DRAFT_619691 [Phlyctochytrium arcticum]